MHYLLVITMSMHVCKLDLGTHVFNAFGFPLNPGVTTSHAQIFMYIKLLLPSLLLGWSWTGQRLEPTRANNML
jgi:hypothetical protein